MLIVRSHLTLLLIWLTLSSCCLGMDSSLSLEKRKQQSVNKDFLDRVNKKDDIKAVEILFDAEIKPELTYCDEAGNTALHRAAQRHHFKIAKFLILKDREGGRKIKLINIQNQKKEVPLHLVFEYQGKNKFSFQNYISMARLFIEYGANLDVVDDTGQTPLKKTLKTIGFHLPLLIPFIQAKQDFELDLEPKEIDEAVVPASNLFDAKNVCKTKNITLSRYVALKQKNLDEKLLSISRSGEGFESIESLVLQGASPEIQCAALHNAASRGHAQVIRLLLENKVPVDNQDADGDTPLHKALRNKQHEAVAILSSYGASGAISNKKGETPLSLAGCSILDRIQGISERINSFTDRLSRLVWYKS